MQIVMFEIYLAIRMYDNKFRQKIIANSLVNERIFKTQLNNYSLLYRNLK